ncbi:hypothetical protein [Cryobacterium tagatosivorans]|uniref:AbiEi antitoxin C-terminal domain-containing protein n=1 Tax=Cryobacterium tagatosivorans TaxID=1259199 RepID=A0A4R8UH24_9MICO|nr:hypothetical protein [Cryobacterium tagatosivorans]TFB55612.1 hypothetical protein E3O23_02325 [Cryobacterium tagatosivorans]
MTGLLAPVLTPDDLPLAELCAARLDGEVYPLVDSWCPVDEVDGPVVRALAAGQLVPPRAIAERMTAAWVYGLVAEPGRHQFCVDHGARTHVPPSQRLQLREVHCAAEETRVIAGLRVTTPLRTVVDLARSPAPGAAGTDAEPGLVALLAALLRLGGFADADAAEQLCRRQNLPHKVIALARLAAAQALLEHPL